MKLMRTGDSEEGKPLSGFEELPHHWPETVEKAKELQYSLADRVRITPLRKNIKTIAGIDAAFAGGKAVAVVARFHYPSLSFIDETHCALDVVFPYVPGYLSFREGPVILCAIKRLGGLPDLLLFDGHGTAHPRRFGIASHLGVILGAPSIGCAKSRLIGTYTEPAPEKGSWSPLHHDGTVVGAVVRTRTGVRPLFVSPGHLITIEESVAVVLCCADRYRIPEPLRAADRLSRVFRKELVPKR